MTPRLLPLLLALWAPSALAEQILWSTPGNGSFQIPAVQHLQTTPPVDFEAADDFDVVGLIRKVVVNGVNLPCTDVIVGARIRFYDHTPQGPGATQFDVFVPAGSAAFPTGLCDQNFLVALPQPFPATGKHFVSFQLVTQNAAQWRWWSGNDGAPTLSGFWVRDHLAGSAWQAYPNPQGGIVRADLGFTLWGDPAPGPPPTQQLWYQGVNWSAAGVPNTAYSHPATDLEAADDFEVHGLIESLHIVGSSLSSSKPTVTGVRVRFYEWQNGQPGALMHDQVSTDFVNGTLIFTVTLPQPVIVQGRAFVSVQLLTTGPHSWKWQQSHPGKPTLSPLWVRDNLSGGTWTPFASAPNADLAFALFGKPFDVPPPVVPTACGHLEPLSVAPPPPSQATSVQLRDLSALSSTDVWAVGFYDAPNPGGNKPHSLPYTQHWDGAFWTTFPTPQPGIPTLGKRDPLDAVAAVAPNDVWAGGTKFVVDSVGFVGQQIFIIHWDGQSWTEVAAPESPQTSGAEVRDIHVSAPNDIWFVGSFPTTTCHEGLALHWDGSSFTRYPTPCAGLPFQNGQLVLNAVDGTAPNDVWAAGGSQVFGTLNPPYVLHWDGVSWNYVSSVPLVGTAMSVSDIAALSSNEVWFLGEAEEDDGSLFPFAMRYDGQSWTSWKLPAPAEALEAFSSNDIYAIGTALVHFDGSDWTIAEDLSEYNLVRMSSLESLGSCQLISAGSHSPAVNFEPLVLHSAGGAAWGFEVRPPCTAFGIPAGVTLVSPPELGGTLDVALDAPFGLPPLPNGVPVLWFVSLAPDPSYPCGTVFPGLGGPGYDGELMVSLAPNALVATVGPVTWVAPGLPVHFASPIPPSATLAGIQLHTQGLFAAPAAQGFRHHLTSALDLTIGY